MACVVVRYHEVALKRGNRPRFVARLVQNIRDSAQGLGVREARSLPGRIVLRLHEEADVEAVCARVGRTFGVVNYSVGYETPLEIEAMREAALALAAAASFRSFRIDARRANKQFPMRSPEIEADLGGLVQSQSGADVDLSHAEFTITVEVLPQSAFVSGQKQRGPGGLPVTISGRVSCLLSGGIDSPVAAYRMMQRGCRVDFVHFHGTPFTSRASLDKARELASVLGRFQQRAKFWDVPFGEIQSEIVARVPRGPRIILYRRMMLRIATALARRSRCRALVTGESLGQVSSQTLPNMSVIDTATPMLVLRPLVGMDKVEIVNQAERIGTFETSILPDEDCCTLFVPAHPTLHATLRGIDEAEAALDVPALVERGVSAANLERLG